MSADMTSRLGPSVLDSNSGFLAVMREFLMSVDRLNDTVLFPVKLQDLNKIPVSPDDTLTRLFDKSAAENHEDMDVFAIYMLLLNTRSEVLTGCDISGLPSGGESLIGQHLRNMAAILKGMTKLANTIKGEYETSLSPS